MLSGLIHYRVGAKLSVYYTLYTIGGTPPGRTAIDKHATNKTLLYLFLTGSFRASQERIQPDFRTVTYLTITLPHAHFSPWWQSNTVN